MIELSIYLIYVLYEIYRKSEIIDCAQSSKYHIIDEGNIKKLIIIKCTTEDIAEYTAVVANVKTSSKLKVEGKFYKILCIVSPSFLFNHMNDLCIIYV